MRRFVEEIHVKDPKLANVITASLELSADNRGNPYEVELYEGNREFDFAALKIFVREIPVI